MRKPRGTLGLKHLTRRDVLLHVPRLNRRYLTRMGRAEARPSELVGSTNGTGVGLVEAYNRGAL
jgi:hypothetical protein